MRAPQEKRKPYAVHVVSAKKPAFYQMYIGQFMPCLKIPRATL